MKQRPVVVIAAFSGGLLMGLLLMRLLAPAQTEGLGAWGAGRILVVALGIAVALAYGTLTIAGAVQSIRSTRSEGRGVPEGPLAGQPLDRILVTAGGGPHARMALRLATEIAAHEEHGAVHLLRVVPSADDVDAGRAALQQMVRDVLGPEETVNLIVRIDSSVVNGILQEAGEGYDLLMVGASEQRALRRWLMGAIPDAVASRAPCAVLLVRA
jgi:nucleotide-binding universal stress UspA family protein